MFDYGIVSVCSRVLQQQRHGRGVAYFHILLKYYDKWYNKGLQNGEIPGELLNKVSYAKSGCKCNN